MLAGLTAGGVIDGNASASADGSTLVRNAARGDSASTSSFYGAGTVISSSLFGSDSSAASSPMQTQANTVIQLINTATGFGTPAPTLQIQNGGMNLPPIVTSIRD